jgi:hypothetical protein
MDEIGVKLFQIMENVISIHSKEKRLLGLDHVVHNLQLSIMWLKEAKVELKSLTQDSLESTTDSSTNSELAIPSIIDLKEQLDYTRQLLVSLLKEIATLIQQFETVPSIKFILQQAFIKATEANFNLQLTTNYYNELRKQ